MASNALGARRAAMDGVVLDEFGWIRRGEARCRSDERAGLVTPTSPAAGGRSAPSHDLGQDCSDEMHCVLARHHCISSWNPKHYCHYPWGLVACVAYCRST